MQITTNITISFWESGLHISRYGAAPVLPTDRPACLLAQPAPRENAAYCKSKSSGPRLAPFEDGVDVLKLVEMPAKAELNPSGGANTGLQRPAQHLRLIRKFLQCPMGKLQERGDGKAIGF